MADRRRAARLARLRVRFQLSCTGVRQDHAQACYDNKESHQPSRAGHGRRAGLSLAASEPGATDDLGSWILEASLEELWFRQQLAPGIPPCSHQHGNGRQVEL